MGFLASALFALLLTITFRLIPVLLSCGKESNMLTTQMVSLTFVQLNTSIRCETEPTFIISLLDALTKSVKIVGGPGALPREAHDGLMEALTWQLEQIADRRRNRAPLPHQPPATEFDISNFDLRNIDTLQAEIGQFKSEMVNFDVPPIDEDEMREDMETFVLNDMGQFLSYLDPMHPLLASVSNVKSLGRNRGLKKSDERLGNVMAAFHELAARFGDRAMFESESESEDS